MVWRFLAAIIPLHICPAGWLRVCHNLSAYHLAQLGPSSSFTLIYFVQLHPADKYKDFMNQCMRVLLIGPESA